ncbi:Cys-tRNA(Pro) deacylase [Nocardioides sp. Y6]|uniref:Cys-tRNA(Pro)/Cys-tRNA(Cys) deacylase n=1 Tax=Nocardioides malaquae TaxID=2773426 RepID=A0ABR9RR37_9ACTN|nr:Cys-tRNA(Pro) deacylase [Nocardioides malaquae]MBE7324024.1 Cys-tRNA(Pro) deacylase [Nocardioides malaquae]
MAKKQARTQGSGTPAIEVLTAAGVAHTLRPYTHDPRAVSYGLEAAEALGVAPARVFKTLVVDTATGGRPALAVGVVPVSRQLDLKAVAAALGAKRAVMADPAVASRSSGYVVGGISPLGQRTPLPTVIDVSARDHATVLVSAGRRGLDVELAPTDLAALLDATWAEISR